MIQVGFLLLLCIAVVTANPSCVSTCKAVTNLDLPKLVGTWYQVRQIKSAPGREGTCETVTYKANADKTLSVDLTWVDGDGLTQKLPGKIKTSGTKPTDGQVTFTVGEKSAIYTIFYLEYDILFGVYTCINKTAYVWLFAQTQEIAYAGLGDLSIAMTDSGLNFKSLKETPRTGCPATY